MNTASGYVKNYFQILTGTQVSYEGNNGLDLNEGIESAIAIIKEQTDSGKKLIFIGNGGSAGIASHSAVDYWRNGKMRAVAFNDGALLTCIGNDFGYERVFEKPVRMFADKGDVLIAISSSGKSENILRGVDAGRDTGCRVITLSGFSGENPLRKKGDLNFYIPSDHYGFVEMGHQLIIHAVLDLIMVRSNER
ncbi:MAG: D-sedoheptulose-7-phosphate isomerase [Bacillota bacterium]